MICSCVHLIPGEGVFHWSEKQTSSSPLARTRVFHQREWDASWNRKAICRHIYHCCCMLLWLRYRWRLIICQLANWLSSVFFLIAVVLLMRNNWMLSFDLPHWVPSLFWICCFLTSSPKAFVEQIKRGTMLNIFCMLALVLMFHWTMCVRLKGKKARKKVHSLSWSHSKCTQRSPWEPESELRM